ncbi:hypothetical protein [Candidatus Solincola sp.]|nr:hypothetical protein [Actinomycetota bacterium]MDI7251443.1 hypothetical protein [Actinomycetota bacterium]
MRRCAGCGVPVLVGKELTWRENGVVIQTKDPDHRMLFYESENLDQLFQGIEEIIGVPIGHIVIESKRREVREYVEKLMPAPVRKMARYVGLKAMIRRLSVTGMAYGYGNVRLSGKRLRFRDDDYVTMLISNPHSLYFFCGEGLGAWEAIDGRESWVRYEEVAPNSYEISINIASHPVELAERLQPPRYAYRPGKVDLRRCPSCGVPAAVASCRWDSMTGTITDPSTGRRMAVFGPAGLEAVFLDLESELGEAIPDTIIEAQRRFTVRTLRREELEGGTEGIREMLAVRGLGLLEEIRLGEEGLSLVLHNACVPLLMAGLFQGAYEVMAGREGSRVAWSMSGEGDLEVRVSPA